MLLTPLAAESPRIRSLESFGDISTPEAAAKTFDQAVAALLAAGGGVLWIPPETPAGLRIENRAQHGVRDPAVSIIDTRDGFLVHHVPPIGKEQSGLWSGTRNDRFLNLSPDSLPHWGSYANEGIQNYVVSGSSSVAKPDAAYAVTATPSWLTMLCVPRKTAQGFTVQFGAVAPAGATVDWGMVR